MGSNCELGSNCGLEGVVVVRWLSLANVDGTGRYVLVVQHAGGVLIRAGCFLGDLDKFVAKASVEGKHVYVAVLTSVVRALEGLEAQV